jgi:pimeloyl-ACP methyl ester carboxylesterase
VQDAWRVFVQEVLGALRGRKPHRLDPLEAALRSRVERPSARAALRTASLCFDTGARDGVWTIRFRGGQVTLHRGRVGKPDSTLIADRDTLVGVLEGTLQGVEEFLGGRLFVRGNLALPLELDDLLHPRSRDVRAPRCHRIRAGGIETFYLEAGPTDGPPVVLLHGLGATSASFLPTIWDLARDHHVYAVDLPGFGESDKPVRPLHAAYFSRWVESFMDAVGLEKADLVGNSMGGRIAIEVGLRSPDRVGRMVLYMPSLAWRRFRIFVRLVRVLRPELGVLPIPMLHAIVLQSIKTMFAHPERVPGPAMKGAADEFVRYFATPRGRVAFFSASREIYLEDPFGRRGFWERLPSLKPPTLFLFGEKDRLVPHGFQRHVQRALPGASFTLMDDCGHVPQFELPDRTNALTREFFGRL